MLPHCIVDVSCCRCCNTDVIHVRTLSSFRRVFGVQSKALDSHERCVIDRAAFKRTQHQIFFSFSDTVDAAYCWCKSSVVVTAKDAHCVI